MACGTEGGWQRHIDWGDAPCAPCTDAHEVTLANARQRYHRRATRQRQYAAAMAGREPAEALLPADRDLLVQTLVRWGWTDVRIAELTDMTTYTTARIRGRLGLPANRPAARRGAA